MCGLTEQFDADLGVSQQRRRQCVQRRPPMLDTLVGSVTAGFPCRPPQVEG
jgi:hypothetical protein